MLIDNYVRDERVKISATDTKNGYLAAKLVASGNVSLSTLTPGGDEKTQINFAATPSFTQVTITNPPTSANQVATKGYVDDFIKGLDWQKSVKDMINFVTSEPVGPIVGDRYINTTTGISSVTGQSVTKDYIYEWNGTNWIEIPINEGFAVWVEDVNTNYVYNGTSWVTFSTSVNHNDLAGVQGGIPTTEFYHLDLSQLNGLISLLYVPLTIASFTNTVNVVEIGSTVNDVTLNWIYGSTPTYPLMSQTLDHGIGIIPLGILTKALTSLGLTSNTTWTLTATNAYETPTASTTLYFRNKANWGSDSKTSLTSADILLLSDNTFATSRSMTKTFDCTGGKYIWICYPTSFGVGTFTVGGFVTTFVESTISHTNASGHTENYYTYRSLYLQYSNSITVVVS